MLRSGGPEVRAGPEGPAARGPGTAGTVPEEPDRREPAGTTADIADRLPGMPGAGGILPAGEASVEGMGWPVVGHTRTHDS